MNGPLRLAIFSAFPTMRTLLVSAFREEREFVVVESGVLPGDFGKTAGPPSGSAPAPGPGAASAPTTGATAAPGPMSTTVPPEIVIIDIDPAEERQLTAARSLRRSRKIPSLLFVPDLTPSQELLFRREGFTAVRRRPKIRDFTTPEGRSPTVELLFALRSTTQSAAGPQTVRRDARDGAHPTTLDGGARPTTLDRSAPARYPVSPDGGRAGPRPGDIPLVVIGASTGGPQAIRHVLQGLPVPIPASVLIVQHISSGFAAGFVRWLRETTHRAVEIAQSRTSLKADQILVAPTDVHLVVRNGYVDLVDGDRRNYQKPSVDVLFESAAEYYGPQALGVLLTGMGRDGGDGCQALVQAGAVTLVQDEGTSIVYGMPRAAVELEAATEILPLEKIGPRVGTLLARGYATNRST